LYMNSFYNMEEFFNRWMFSIWEMGLKEQNVLMH
jgi:hypothetical protein